MDALCALLDCALGFFPCYFLFGCNRLGPNIARMNKAVVKGHVQAAVMHRVDEYEEGCDEE